MLRKGATDIAVLAFITSNSRLVVLTKNEAAELDRVNRSGIAPA
jgi:hypothetical protein